MKLCLRFAIFFMMLFGSGAAFAAPATAIGTVKHVQQQGETNQYTTRPQGVFTFTLSQPINVPGAQYQFFAISAETVPLDADRNGMISIILLALSLGKELQVSYDDAGAYMDTNMVGVYYVSLRP